MYHSLATLRRTPIVTTDGLRRPIRNVLFDDRSWLIRFLIVDAGAFFGKRLVVVPVTACDVPDWTQNSIAVNMNADQLLNCPDADSVRPVSRQQQIAWNRHFGWPENDPTWFSSSSRDIPGMEFPVGGEDDPHLRRALDLISYQIWGSGGPLGSLEGFFLKDASWHIEYLLVRAGGWECREKAVPTQCVASISWGQRRVVLDTAAEVSSFAAPRVPHSAAS
jgi:hypothetical protein